MASKRKILKTSLPENKDFVLYGIVSSANDYRIAWLLNNTLNIELKKTDDLDVEIKKLNETCYYTRYSTETDDSNIGLISNKDSNSIKLFKMEFDYLLKISSNYNKLNNIKDNLNQINEIILSSEIIPNTKNNISIIEKTGLYL